MEFLAILAFYASPLVGDMVRGWRKKSGGCPEGVGPGCGPGEKKVASKGEVAGSVVCQLVDCDAPVTETLQKVGKAPVRRKRKMHTGPVVATGEIQTVEGPIVKPKPKTGQEPNGGQMLVIIRGVASELQGALVESGGLSEWELMAGFQMALKKHPQTKKERYRAAVGKLLVRETDNLALLREGECEREPWDWPLLAR